MNVKSSFDSLGDFVDRPEELVARVKDGAPLVLTVAGKARLVVQEADAYADLLGRVERRETMEALQEGLRAADEGRKRPLTEALADIKQRHGISD